MRVLGRCGTRWEDSMLANKYSVVQIVAKLREHEELQRQRAYDPPGLQAAGDLGPDLFEVLNHFACGASPRLDGDGNLIKTNDRAQGPERGCAAVRRGRSRTPSGFGRAQGEPDGLDRCQPAGIRDKTYRRKGARGRRHTRCEPVNHRLRRPSTVHAATNQQSEIRVRGCGSC